MASQLTDRLTDLAVHTPAGDPPPDLWVRGIRQRRARRLSASALVAVLALMLGMGVWSWHLSRQEVTPVAPRGAPQLPDRFYEPSPWLGNFSGPPGPLVAIGSADQSTMFHTTERLYGVTATGGQYGFLDLPEAASTDLTDSSPALSPDGRHVAYWVDPRTTQRANDDAVGGLAIYDTVSGRVRYFRETSAHGFSGRSLLWADDHIVVFSLSTWKTGGSGGAGHMFGSYSWFISGPVPDRFRPATSRAIWFASDVTATGGVVVAAPLIVYVDANATVTMTGQVPDTWPAFLNPDHRSLATLGGQGSPSKLAILPVTGKFSSGQVRVGAGAELDTGPRVYMPLRWMDRTHLAALAPGRPHADSVTTRVIEIDVTTGAARTLVQPTPGDLPTLATGLLDAPAVHASPPPSPVSPRTVAWICAGVGAVAIFVLGLFLLSRDGRRGRRA